jgi:alpha-tubulin suppressor-like RCC1 family protein
MFIGDPECKLGECSGHPIPVLDAPDGDPIVDAKTVTMIADVNHTCIIREGGGVWCWGETLIWSAYPGFPNIYEPQKNPVLIEGLPGPAVDIFGGGSAICALLEDSSVWCWGKGETGIPGVSSGTADQLPSPQPLRYGPDGDIMYGIVDVAMGGDISVLFENGEVWSWGGIYFSNGIFPSPLLFNGQPVRHGWKLDHDDMSGATRTVYTTLGQVIHTVFKSGSGGENVDITYRYDHLCVPEIEEP